MSSEEERELEQRAALDALEAYVDRYRETYGEACRMRPANSFTATSLMAALIKLQIAQEKGNVGSVRAWVETAVCMAEVDVFGEVRS